MPERFCPSCGAQRLPDARFCGACGLAFGSGALPPRRGRDLGRWAPVAVLGTVLLVAGAAIVTGAARERPAPRIGGGAGASGAQASLPQGHPPIELPDDVRESIRRAVQEAEAQPSSLDLWRRAAEMQYRAAQIDRGYLDGAEKAYRHILERKPGDAMALRGLGNVAYDREQWQQAIGYYEQYLERRPEDLDARTDLGTMYLARRDPRRAIALYREVLERDPRHFQAQFNLAVAYRVLGEEAEMRRALERAREIAPDEEMRRRVEHVIAQLDGKGTATAESRRSLREQVENVFRGHPILGPKIDRIEWPSPAEARVVVREFPMASMPAPIREKFLARLRSGLEAARRHQGAKGALKALLIDAASGQVLATVEAPQAAPAGKGAS